MYARIIYNVLQRGSNMFKRKAILSIMFSALTLGLITTGFINNNDKVVEAKAEEEKAQDCYS